MGQLLWCIIGLTLLICAYSVYEDIKKFKKARAIRMAKQEACEQAKRALVQRVIKEWAHNEDGDHS